MFITYISQWLYTVMQLPVPIVLSPNHIYSITIFNLFIGVLLLGIFMILIERAFNGLSWSDFRIKERVPETIDKANSSNDLNGYDNMGRRRFYGNSSRSKTSIGQKIINRRNKERISEKNRKMSLSNDERRKENLDYVMNNSIPYYSSLEEYKKIKGKE